MTPESNDPELSPAEHWTEPRLERLLDWFFTQEVPPALRDAGPVAHFVPPRRAMRQPVAMGGRWLISLCAAALIGCGWLLWQLPSRELARVAKRTPPPAVELETASLPWQVEQVSYQGATGTFQQRIEYRWNSSSSFDPASGVWVEWSAPELAIDIDVEPVAKSDSKALSREL